MDRGKKVRRGRDPLGLPGLDPDFAGKGASTALPSRYAKAARLRGDGDVDHAGLA